MYNVFRRKQDQKYPQGAALYVIRNTKYDLTELN